MNKVLSRSKKNVIARSKRAAVKTRRELVRYVVSGIESASSFDMPDLSSFSDSSDAPSAADDLEQLAMDAEGLASDATRLASIIRGEEALLESKEESSEQD